MGRILSIDYGTKRIGLALSDPTKTIASPFKAIQTGKNHEQTIVNLLKEISLQEIETILIGLPLHLSSHASELSELVRQFAAALEEKTGLPIVLWDERLTSRQVERILIEGNVRRKKRIAHVDTMSAALILQNYLDSL